MVVLQIEIVHIFLNGKKDLIVLRPKICVYKENL